MWTSHLKRDDVVQIGDTRIQVLEIGKRRVQIAVDTDPNTKIAKIPAKEHWEPVETADQGKDA